MLEGLRDAQTQTKGPWERSRTKLFLVSSGWSKKGKIGMALRETQQGCSRTVLFP